MKALAFTLSLIAISVSGCASSGATPYPFPSPSRSHPPVPAPPERGGGGRVERPLPDELGYALAGTALALRGAPYRSGGADPAGFDCSGFVHYVFERHGVPVPRTVAEQVQTGIPVAPEDLAPGDLVFFATKTDGPSHVAIAVGGDEFVHAPNSRGAVRVDRLNSSYWGARVVEIRRVMQGDITEASSGKR